MNTHRKPHLSHARTRYFGIIIALSICSFNCNEVPAPPASKTPVLFIFGYDLSGSFKGYRKLDAVFLDSLCAPAANAGGLVVAYGIGNPTKSTGIRCSFEALPQMDESLVLSEQAALKAKIESIAQRNARARQDFVRRVDTEILNAAKRVPQQHTDIEGFFAKAGLLIAEPEYRSMRKFVFVYSDGIQSTGGADKPARCRWEAAPEVTLCLAGWTAALPTDKINIKRFEDPSGFIAYLQTL